MITPANETQNISLPSTISGSKSRRTASHSSTPVISQTIMMLTSAPSTSARWYPKV